MCFNLTVCVLINVIACICQALSAVTILDKGIYPLERNSVGIQFYLDVENSDKSKRCKVHSWPQKCCLRTEDRDCDRILVHGNIADIMKPKDRGTFVFVYPTVIQDNLVGYCDFVLDAKCSFTKAKRNIINVRFDTRRLKHSRGLQFGMFHRKVCASVDQDGTNNCKPVNCIVKYLGRRPYYDPNTRSCVKAPKCCGAEQELPASAYLPIANTCRDLEHPLTLEDIYKITSNTDVVTVSPKVDRKMELTLKSNCSSISQNLHLLRDMMYGRLCPSVGGFTVDYSKCCKSAMLSILICILLISIFIISFVICVNSLMSLCIKWFYGSSTLGSADMMLEKTKRKPKKEYLDPDVRNALLRDIIKKGLPLELRDSYENVYERIRKEIGPKKRYRSGDVGSQTSLLKDSSAPIN